MANPFLIQKQKWYGGKNIKQDFEVNGVKYQFDLEHVDDLLLHNMSVNTKHHGPSVQTRPNRGKIITGTRHTFVKIVEKCKSQHHDKTAYHLDEHGIIYRKCWNGSNIFHAIMVPKITTLHSI